MAKDIGSTLLDFLTTLEKPVIETALPLAEKAADVYIAAQTGPLAPIAVQIANILFANAQTLLDAGIPTEEQQVAVTASVTSHPANAAAVKAAA